ncbi:hypothetical protein SLA2020_254360 [Shorea laevis]
MGFAVGSSCFLQSPIPHSQIISSPSQSVFLRITNAESKKRRNRAAMASLRDGDLNYAISNKRRAVLLVGISVLPLLQLRAGALEGVAKTESEPNKLEEKKMAELEEGGSPPNPILSLLNGLGIFGTSVFGPLYALAQKEKKANDATIELMKIKLQEKEAAIVSLEKNFESKLLHEQEQRTKELNKAKEEQLSLIDQLNSAKKTITGLGQEVKNEKRLIEQLKIQIDSLENDLLKAGEDKKSLEEELKEKLDSIESLQERTNLLGLELKDREDNIQKVRSSLVGKEFELKNSTAMYEQTKDDLAKALSEIQGLKGELLKNEKELESKSSLADELNAKLSSLTVERDGIKREFGALQKEYSDLKLSSEKKEVADAKLLGERENEIDQLKQKIELVLEDVSESQAIVTNLTAEREHLRGLLNVELSNAKSLKKELEVTQEALGISRNGASELSKQLKQSENLCAELESEISKIQAEFEEARNGLHRSLDEAKHKGEVLASELKAVKELLKKTSDELQTVSHELTCVLENRDSLQKELVDVYKKAEATANDLKEEKRMVSSLNKELQALEKQISKDKEAKKSLETDLEAATKSLDEMNHNALSLSRELEMANATISSLEDEKMVLYKSLTEQKNVAIEARENMEDAHNIVLTLDKERESLEKRATKLQDELATAKGEILRLRNQINSSRLLVNDQNPQKGEAEAEAKVTADTKRNRRRKTGSQ